MKKLLTAAILAGLLLPTALWAQSRDCYVYKTDGSRQKVKKSRSATPGRRLSCILMAA